MLSLYAGMVIIPWLNRLEKLGQGMRGPGVPDTKGDTVGTGDGRGSLGFTDTRRAEKPAPVTSWSLKNRMVMVGLVAVMGRGMAVPRKDPRTGKEVEGPS